MKHSKLKISFTLVLALGVVMPPQVAGMDMSGMPEMGSGSGKTSEAASDVGGVIRQIDSTKGIVTIAHEPIQSLGWPAMTMDFLVKDPALLKKCVQGRAVHFTFVRQRGEYVVTELR